MATLVSALHWLAADGAIQGELTLESHGVHQEIDPREPFRREERLYVSFPTRPILYS